MVELPSIKQQIHAYRQEIKILAARKPTRDKPSFVTLPL
jgi:hypothetical protein